VLERNSVTLFFCSDLGLMVTKLIYHRGSFDDRMVLLVSGTAAALSLGLAPFACMMLMRQYSLAAGGPCSYSKRRLFFFAVKAIGNFL